MQEIPKNLFEMAEKASLPLRTPNFRKKKKNLLKSFTKLQKTSKSKKKKLILLITFILLTFTIFFILKKNGKLLKFLTNLEKKLKFLYKKKPNFSLFLMFLLMLTIFFFALPGHMLGSIFCSIIISDFEKSFFYLSLFSIISSLIIYLYTNFFCKSFFKDLFKNNKIVNLIEKDVLRNSFKISCVVRCLFIAGGLKDYVLSVLEVGFFSFFFSSVLFNAFFAGVYAGIGCEFEEIREFMKNPKDWSEKSLVEKICFFFIFLSITVSVFIFFVLGLWFRKRLKEKEVKDLKKLEEFEEGAEERAV